MTRFPDDFLWGAATSSYQIEGSPLADGAGKSIWHEYSHTPGRVEHGHTGDVACDHYNRYRSDVELMAFLGLQAYRFSIAWARVLPEGTGRPNEAGLDFYDRLVDTLLEHGIEPMATLYHWDLPVALNDRGGWLNPDMRHWFAEYAEVMTRRLGDRVAKWATINEPWVIMNHGFVEGVMAPGHVSRFEAARVSYHLLQAHASGLAAIKASGGKEAGIVVNLEKQYPHTDAEADVRAFHRADAYFNRHFLDPIYFGSYPDEMPEVFGDAWPDYDPADLAALKAPGDFLGINYYSGFSVRHDDTAGITRAARVPDPTKTITNFGWDVNPESFRDILVWAGKRYGAPIYITENGSSFYDPPIATESVVEDPLRVKYLRDHLNALADARQAGVDVRGYYAWSLFDNFEWAAGYTQRFGIVHVNFETQERTPKRSSLVYKEIIETNGASLEASDTSVAAG
ncbi:MAG: GH1 family beta-glucosidase [Bacteroidota bacterium]